MTGFPGLGLLRSLRPIPAPSADDGPARRRPGWPAGRATPGRFPRSPRDRSTGSAPSSAPAASPRLRRRPSPWPPGRRLNRRLGVAAPAIRRAAAHCSPAHIHQVRAGGPRLRGFNHWFLSLHLSVSLAGPAPSGSAGTSRRCQGCFPPSPASPGSGCPQLHRPAATGPTAKVSHLHSVTQRLVAHGVGRPDLAPVLLGNAVKASTSAFASSISGADLREAGGELVADLVPLRRHRRPVGLGEDRAEHRSDHVGCGSWARARAGCGRSGPGTVDAPRPGRRGAWRRPGRRAGRR